MKRYNNFIVGRPGYWAMMLALAFATLIIDPATADSSDVTEVAVFVLGLLVIAQFVITASRCRDAGLNGWWCLTIIIPFVMIYFGCIRPDDHPRKLHAFEKLRVNQPNTLDAPKAREDGHTLIDIPHSTTSKICGKCHRPMAGTTAYDGACKCGGLIADAEAEAVKLDPT
ncbi:hypothetical protein LCGC14_1305540 [marine sediment metagenome]|uniref:DUF805 domain-containing protein n=1 Tax=marine sediment metagenome TaxID=412755 RepID=A0A0F9KNW4_9ZZZZ